MTSSCEGTENVEQISAPSQVNEKKKKSFKNVLVLQ